MGIPPILPAGFATWTERIFKCSQSIVRTLDVRSAGSRNLVCSFARAMEELFSRMVRALLARRNADCSNPTTKSTPESCSSKPARCRRRGRLRIWSEEYGHAPDFFDRGMVGRALAAWLHHP